MKKATAAAITAMAFITGCWLPEKFEASFDFNSKGGYTMLFEGTVWNGPALKQKVDTGKLPEQAAVQMKAELAKISRDPSVKQAKLVGDTRASVKIENKTETFRRTSLFQVLSVSQDRTGVYQVSGIQLKDAERAEVRRLGANIKGTLKVKLPPNATVVQSNAQSTPGVFSSTYGWTIDDSSPAPVIRFKLQ